MLELPPIVLISSFSVLMPLVVSFFYRGTYASELLRLRVLLWFMVLFQATSFYLMEKGVDNTMPVYHLYVGVEFVVTLWVFEGFSIRIMSKKFFIALLSIFVILATITHWDWEEIYSFPNVLRTYEGLVLILLSLYFFWNIMKSDEERDLLRLPGFWISVGVLIYFSANLLLFYYGNFMASQNHEVFDAIWQMHAALNLILYLVYTIAFLCPIQIKK